ncbi:ATP-dependent DNA helicase [Methanoregula sp.]|uniref:ATP-dependent DNA helicase n=1 Tax=Methanoregula sp. TaxID=2052170 RepID=UPI000CBC9817|nr:ATP-dependent DNA helicase [Methanoregula sp.]PKG33761.1 MAG: helicase [Methanoregula sp.]
MDSIDTFFPYSEYRPGQRHMLEVAATVARDGGIAMIDAPTGSGKSSVVASLLAERRGRKIVIAVRTVSQLTTFIRELELVKKKAPQIKTVYLVGKKSMCPLGGEGDVYRRCEGVKAFSNSLMRDRAEKGAMIPAKDPFIIQQIRRMDKEHPLLCPYYINSKMFVPAEGVGVRMVPSTELRNKADRVIANPVPPRDLTEYSSGLCPYELMMHAAKNTDVVILNYHHLFDRQIREQLYANLGVEEQDILLLIDEAHNCGDVITGIESVTMEERDLEQASRELSGMARRHKGAEAVRHVLPRLTEFIRGLQNSVEAEDWFDPAIFDRMIVRESLYKDMDEIVDDLMGLSETIREKNIKGGEFRETAIERLTEFLLRLSNSATDPAFLTVYRKEESGITLEVRSIDPAASLSEVCGSHACTILISGTLSPVESFRKYYFGNGTVTTLSLPNAFPKENRLIACANDITTAYSMRQNKDNTNRIAGYIRAFSALKGNRAIYFPSYQILESYAELTARDIRGKKVFIEPRDAAGAGAALTEFLSLPSRRESGVMFAVAGGKWSEGLDYRGEMMAGAMVIGLPLAPFNRVRKMMIEYFRHKFGAEGEFLCYTLPAVNRSLQALGRVLRTPEDRGVLVLGEKRFLEKKVKDALPAWIQEEMIAGDYDRFREVLAQWKP